MISENKMAFVYCFFKSHKSLVIPLVILAPVFHFRRQQYVGELTPVVYSCSLSVWGTFVSGQMKDKCLCTFQQF